MHVCVGVRWDVRNVYLHQTFIEDDMRGSTVCGGVVCAQPLGWV